MDDFARLFGNHAVVKTRANGDNHIGIVHGQIGFVCAVHAEHAQILLPAGRKCAQAHQRAGAGNVQRFHKFNQFFGRVAQRYAAAEIHQRAFRRRQHLHGFFDLSHMTIHNRLVRTDENVFLRVAEFGIGLCHIFGNIDHHGARTACACDLEGFLDGRRQIFHFGNQKIVLHARTGNAHHINFLERVAANHGRADLPRNHHQRNRIAICRGNTGNRIGCAGAGSDQRHADLAANAGIRIGRVDGSLLVAGQNMFEFMKLVNGVVDFQYCAAGITENVFHVFRFKTVHENLCA